MTGIPSVGSGAAGLAQAQARMAEIRGRLSEVQGFALPGAPAAAPAALPAAPGAVPVAPTAGGLAPVSGDAGGAPGAALPPGQLASKLPPAGQRWAASIERAATEHGVDPALLAALVNHESNFDPNARSHAGAIGLGQLMPGTAAGLGVDPHDPEQNLDGAARYLKTQLDRFGRVDLALAAYNAGPNRVAQAGGVPRIAETQAYVAKVTSTYERWRS